MSSTVPSLAMGTCAVNAVRCSSFNERVMSVSMNPGASALTVMPREAISFASDLVNPRMPALAAA